MPTARLPYTSPVNPADEIKRLYYSATKQTINEDLARAIELLKSMPDEEERDRVAVYMNGLSSMRSEWRQGGHSATSPKPPPSSGRPHGADRGRSGRSTPRERRGR